MEKSLFWNSSDDDRVLMAEEFLLYFSVMISEGIFPCIADNLKVLPGNGLNIVVSVGSASLEMARLYHNDSPKTLPIAPDIALPRINRVVVRCDKINRVTTAEILTGTPATNPVPPPLTRDVSVWELCLADIHVPANASAISAGNIIDTRLDPSLCGVVNSLVAAVYE